MTAADEEEIRVRLSRAVRAIDSVASETDGDYSGARLDQHARSITIFRVSPMVEGSPLASSYEALIPHGVELRYAPSVLTRRQVQSLDALVDSHNRQWASDGIDVSLCGLDQGWDSYYAICYHPDGKAPGPAEAAPFDAYPAGTVRFQPGGAVPV